MPIHPVRRKLERAILPYIVSARRLKWRLLYVAHSTYAYGHELAVALVGIGISHPVLAALNEQQPKVVGATVPASNDPRLLAPAALAALVVAWAILKITVTRADGEKRATLARSCRREFRQLTVRMREELSKADPMPGLEQIQKEINAIVQRNIAEESWPWDGSCGWNW